MSKSHKSPRGDKKQKHRAIPRRDEVSAGGVVWRRHRNGAVDVALIRPHGSNAWSLPKGHLEEGESAREAAVREVREETGLEVGGAEPLGEIKYVFSWRDRKGGPLTRIFKRVEYFLMDCTGGDIAAHDHEIDEVVWLPLKRAIARATYDNERELLGKARGRLTSAPRRRRARPSGPRGPSPESAG
jgi:8-oxo-dGTP pyrophosphatase MutT (NUDIX family)